MLTSLNLLLKDRNMVFSRAILFIAITPVFFGYLISDQDYFFDFCTGVYIMLVVLCFRINRTLFPTILFFAILFISKPLNNKFSALIGADFTGVYYLLPTVFFTALILLIPSVRRTISWWQVDKVTKKTILFITVSSVISVTSLYVWGLVFSSEIGGMAKKVAEGSWHFMLLNGICFAVLNSLVEEYMSRGMLQNGLQIVFSNKETVIFTQAAIFGLFHYQGFPGGFTGMAMVFIWSVFLGIVRYQTKGLLGVWAGHFVADFAIYFILLGFKNE